MPELTKQQKMKCVENHIISKGFTGNKKNLEEVFQFLYGFETVYALEKYWVSWEYRLKKLTGVITIPNYTPPPLEEYVYETVKNREGFRLVGTEWIFADSQ